MSNNLPLVIYREKGAITMNHVLKKLPHVFVLLLLIITATGCFNIFGFTSDKEQSPVEKAEEAIRDGDYAKARQELEGEIETTDDSMVLYTYAKAVILEANLDIATIVDLVQGETSVEDGFNNPILEKFDSLSLETQNAWYKSNIEVSRVLFKIWDQQVMGDLDKNDIALDYTVANVMTSILGLRDINQDQEINPDVDFSLDLISIDVNGGGFVLGDIQTDENGIPIIDQNTGKPLNAGLTAFLGEYLGKSAGGMAESIKPDDINPFINFILTKLGEGEESIRFLMDQYLDDDDASSIDYNEIQKYITDIGMYVNYYWYNDGIDNDNDGNIDEETIDGIDNDGDGLIDEDSDYHSAGEVEVDITDYIGMFESWLERI